jgi:CRP/FNR family transcriptional regulator, cyclic AMP receptor protein
MSPVPAEELGEHRFAAGLAGSQLALLAGAASQVTFRAGTRIFAEGGLAASFWLISAGRVALDLRIPGRGLVIVETIGPGDELGLSWIAPPARWQFGARAQQPVTAFELDCAAVVALCQADHELGLLVTQRLLGTAVRRMQAARVRLLDLYGAPGQPAGNAR